MMIDFEDRQPAPPMGIGERALMAVIAATTAHGLYANGVAMWNMAWDLFR